MKLIKFKQDNCTPCKILEDTLTRVGGKVDETINLTTGTSEDFVFAGKYNIMKTPVLLLLDNEGNQLARVDGVGQTKVMAILEQRYGK